MKINIDRASNEECVYISKPNEYRLRKGFDNFKYIESLPDY